MSSQMCHDFTWDILYWAGKAAAWLGVRDSLQTNFKFTHSEQEDWRQCFQKDNTQKMWLFKAILCKLRKKSLGRERSRTWSPTIYCYYWKRKGKVLVTQSCPTLWHPMDCSPAGSSVHGDSPGKNTRAGCHALLQRIFPIQISCITGGFFTVWVTREAREYWSG